MLIDSFSMVEGATISNLTVGSGMAFPSDASIGELFLKLDDGLHIFNGSIWKKVDLLDSNGKIQSSFVPAIAITDTYVVASQAAMLAISGAETGDVCVRTDLSKCFILKGSSASTLSDWQELLSPGFPVLSTVAATGSYDDLLNKPAQAYDLVFSTSGKNTDSEVVFSMRAARAFTIPANFSGAIAKAVTGATAQATYIVAKNGIQVGTIVFTASGTNGAFSVQSAIDVAINDRFTITAPAAADPTLADIDFSIPATLA